MKNFISILISSSILLFSCKKEENKPTFPNQWEDVKQIEIKHLTIPYLATVPDSFFLVVTHVPQGASEAKQIFTEAFNKMPISVPIHFSILPYDYFNFSVYTCAKNVFCLYSSETVIPSATFPTPVNVWTFNSPLMESRVYVEFK